MTPPNFFPKPSGAPPMRVLTWNGYPNYLYNLAQAGAEFYLPVKPGRPTGYGGRTHSHPWPDNVHEIPAAEVSQANFDVVLFQSPQNYLEDQYEILTSQQRRLPAIYLEHEPPGGHLTGSRHLIDDANILLVHVTHFNKLMWESGKTPTTVIEHGVTVPPGVRYSGELTRGLVIANHIQQHSRRSGEDVFKRVRLETPLDLVGAQSEALGGLGYIPPDRLPAFAARYRFVFSPSRYTSLSLALCEAMMLGLPIIGLATTELVAVVHNGVSGYLDTDISRLIDAMQLLLGDHAEAARLGQGARRLALQRFNIQRFARDWEAVFEVVTGKPVAPRLPLRKPIQSSVDMGE